MAKTPCLQCRGPGFDTWSGNEVLHATAEEPPCPNEDGKPPLPQLRPSIAKQTNKYMNTNFLKGHSGLGENGLKEGKIEGWKGSEEAPWLFKLLVVGGFCSSSCPVLSDSL